ncbi:MAG: hypothetical protein Q4E88_02955 [Coriobacteriia bacterium]|nr:hypothetical protein [Coriobacteriia bacterium]
MKEKQKIGCAGILVLSIIIGLIVFGVRSCAGCSDTQQTEPTKAKTNSIDFEIYQDEVTDDYVAFKLKHKVANSYNTMTITEIEASGSRLLPTGHDPDTNSNYFSSNIHIYYKDNVNIKNYSDMQGNPKISMSYNADEAFIKLSIDSVKGIDNYKKLTFGFDETYSENGKTIKDSYSNRACTWE